jgi:hypothetical protein
MKKVNTFTIPVLEQIVKKVFPEQEINLEEVNKRQFNKIKKYVANELENNSHLAGSKILRIVADNNKEITMLETQSAIYYKSKNAKEKIPCIINLNNENSSQIYSYLFHLGKNIHIRSFSKSNHQYTYPIIFYENLW